MSGETGDGFRSDTLSRRTASLAMRGLGDDTNPAVLPRHLVCETRGRLHALAPALVETVLPAVWHRISLIAASAAPAMLGIVGRGGQPCSLLDLGYLFGDGAGRDRTEATGSMTAGTMLLLRRLVTQDGPAGRLIDYRVAVRVDRVLGLLALHAAGDGHGLLAAMPGDIAPVADGRLVSLIDADTLGTAIAALDHSAGRTGA